MTSKRYYVSVPVTKSLRQKLEKVAKNDGRPLAQFVRLHLIKLASGKGNSAPCEERGMSPKTHWLASSSVGGQ